MNDPALSSAARKTIDDALNDILVSPASYWETAIKVSLGKYTLNADFDDFWTRVIEGNDFEVLPISVAHAKQVSTLPFHHRDPFDRLMIAQAMTEQIPVLSADDAFDAYPVRRVW